jgi:hypothetical protein
MMGSGPKTKRLLAATWVVGDNQVVGKVCGGKPSNTNDVVGLDALFDALFGASVTGCQRTGTPLLLDLARADSSSADKRSASRSKTVCAESRKLKLTAAVPMAIRAMTTNNSIKVKPKEEAAGILSRARTSDESDALATAFNLGST